MFRPRIYIYISLHLSALNFIVQQKPNDVFVNGKTGELREMIDAHILTSVFSQSFGLLKIASETLEAQ